LYDEGVRKPNKTIERNSILNRQHHRKRQAATTTELSQIDDPPMSITRDNDDYSHEEE
jgi:hypothetical protein